MKFFSFSETAETLWQTLSVAGLVQNDMPDNPTKACSSDLPWFVKAMVGTGAWISSLFFLLFVALFMGNLFNSEVARATFGVIACALAAFCFRKNIASVFLEQLFFVLALLGNALVLSVIFSFSGSDVTYNSTALLLAALFEALILAAIPYQPNRLLSALGILLSLRGAVFFWGVAGLFMPLCLAMLAIALHIQWRRPRLWPMVALALCLAPFLEVEPRRYGGMPCNNLLDFLREIPLWWWQMALIAAWLGVVYALLKRVTVKPLSLKNIGVWLLAFILAAGTWPAPLALFALAVLLLGFSQRDKLIEGIGVLQLLWSVGYYYYALQDTLLFKSLTLSALGAALLLLYAISHFLLPETGHNEGEKP
ncbi:MAG: DUF4401 domain-containing protein [Burkholderiales bacterium]|jgi:hypothetical protein|nr:DUF4401 domain-containing protein [Burkholderiales bacterium]